MIKIGNEAHKKSQRIQVDRQYGMARQEKPENNSARIITRNVSAI